MPDYSKQIHDEILANQDTNSNSSFKNFYTPKQAVSYFDELLK